MNIVLLASVVTTFSVVTSPRDAWEQEIQSPGLGAQVAGIATSAKRTRAEAKREARCARAIIQGAVLERNLTVPFNERVYRTEVGMCTPIANDVVQTKTRIASEKPPYREKILAPFSDDQWKLLAAWRKALGAWSEWRDDAKQPI